MTTFSPNEFPAPVHNSSSPCTFDGDHLGHMVQSFFRHETVKLKEETYVQWQHQIKIIIKSYDLIGYILGALSTPSRFVANSEWQLVSNPNFFVYHKQDKCNDPIEARVRKCISGTPFSQIEFVNIY